MPLLTRVINKFIYGIIDSVDALKLPLGAASVSLNFVTAGNRIELRRGYHLLGDTELSGAGVVLGLHVAQKADGTAVLFRKRGRKLEYLDTSLSPDDWVETGTNIFPTAAEDDEVSFANYASLAGNQMFVCSPNAGPFKIMVANPGSYTDLTDGAKNFQGYIKIKQNRMFLWRRNADKTGIYGSYIDAAAYTTVSGEATTSLSGTLAFKAGGAVRTCFAVAITITASGEVYTDNYDGTLTGSLGGTGTINYTTGAYTLSNAGAGTASYQWENSNNTGITDFTKSATRTAGQGFVFRQDDGGGAAQNVLSYGDTEFCKHEIKTWALTLTADDTNATNLIYRDRVGIPNWRAAVESGDGIYYIDDTDEKDPQFRKLTLEPLSAQVIPVSISKARRLSGELVGLSLTDYRFDKGTAIEWGEQVLFACRTLDSTVNNRVISYNKVNGALDVHEYFVSCFAIYNGVLVAGDSLTNNVYELFSGLDDDESLVAGFWESGLTDLQIEELKKTKRLVIEGNIGPNQNVTVSLAVDHGPYVDIGTIEGDGSYVDTAQQVHVGAVTVGSKEVGGGGEGIEAYHYLKEIKPGIDKFSRIKIKFTTTEIGWFDVSSIRFRRIRVKTLMVPSRYRET